MTSSLSSCVSTRICLYVVVIFNSISIAASQNKNSRAQDGTTGVSDIGITRHQFIHKLEKDIFFNSIPVSAISKVPTANVTEEYILRGIKGRKCRSDMAFLLREIRYGISGVTPIQKSLLEGINSWGTVPPGVFQGNHHSIGDFTLCVLLHNIRGANETRNINGKYCLTSFQFLDQSIPQNIRQLGSDDDQSKIRQIINKLHRQVLLGMCFPQSCSEKDIGKLVNAFSDPLPPIMLGCTANKTREPTQYSLIRIFFLAFPCLVVVATITDYLMDTGALPNTPRIFLQSFSLFWNMSELTKPDYVGVLNSYNTDKLRIESVMATIVHDSRLFVDTFFVISGILAGYGTSRMLKLQPKWSFQKLLVLSTLKRFFRMTPTLLIVLALAVGIGDFSTGPFSYVVASEVKSCRKYWWQNVLFVHNLIFNRDENRRCLSNSWFLSADLQFFIICLPLVYFLCKRPKLGVLLSSVITFLSCSITYFYMRNTNSTSLIVSLLSENEYTYYYRNIYFNPSTRIVPYLFGTILGSARLLYSAKYFEIASKPVKIFSWILSLFSLGFILMNPPAQYFVTNPGKIGIIYYCTHRLVYGASTGWLLFTISMEEMSSLKNFLLATPFVVISRLSLPLFLVSWVVQTYLHASSLQAMPIDTLYMVSCFIAHFVLSLIAAVIIWLFYANPISKFLDGIFFERHVSKRKML